MDPILNPFSPGAGSPPPELVGRDSVLEMTRILLGRILNSRSEKSLLLTGLRGVGKTVLLNEMKVMAEDSQYHTIYLEIHEGKSLAQLLAPKIRELFFSLNRVAGAGNKVKRGLAVLRSFVGALKVNVGEIEIGLDIDPERGTADSGDLEIDLPNLFVALAEAAKERHTGVAILIDEIQYLSQFELSALIMAMHQMQQRRLPLVLLGAGLPVLLGLAGESKSYAERLFNFPSIGPLNADDAAKALQDPVKEVGVRFDHGALDKIYSLTQGYPYFIQEWGYQTWNHAPKSPITVDIVNEASRTTIDRLDNNFFRVRFDRLTPKEKDILRAMAELGPGAHRTGEIADIVKISHSTLAPVRAKLIKKGMIYSPAHGEMAFTVPLFDEFMRRIIPNF